MNKPVILVTGKNGQLGKELQILAPSNNNFNFVFFDRTEMNVADETSVKNKIEEYKPFAVINCAAYTAVDKAETNQEDAYINNAEATGFIAKYCNEVNAVLIHVSTDYVFNGKGEKAYLETDETEPVNYYGYTKWLGEQLALSNNPSTIIIRTSWVYSSFGNNFVKTMLRLMNERKEINVVSDQFGSPTYAKDLAEAIVEIVNSEWLMVNSDSQKVDEDESSKLKVQSYSGIYHFSNEGEISWYDFAVAIKQIKQLDCIVHPIPTTAYPTPAKRPQYSVMDKSKITDTFNIQLKNWEHSLKECLQAL